MNKKLTSGKSREYARLLRETWRQKNPGRYLSSEEDNSDQTVIMSSSDEGEVDIIELTSKKPVDENIDMPCGRKIMAAIEDVPKEDEMMKKVRKLSEELEKSSERKQTTEEECRPSTSREGYVPEENKGIENLNISSKKFKMAVEKAIERLERAEKEDKLAKEFLEKARQLLLGRFDERADHVEARAARRKKEGDKILNYLKEEGMWEKKAPKERQKGAQKERIIVKLPNRPISRTPSPESMQIGELEDFAEEIVVEEVKKEYDWKLQVQPVVRLERIQIPKCIKNKPKIIKSEKIFIKVKMAKPTKNIKEIEKEDQMEKVESMEEDQEKIPATKVRRARPNVIRDISSDKEDKKNQKKNKKLHHMKRAKFVKAYQANLELQGEMYSCIRDLGETDAAEKILERYEAEQLNVKQEKTGQIENIIEIQEDEEKEYTSLNTSATLSAITAVVPYTGSPFEQISKGQEGGMQPTAALAKFTTSTPVEEIPSKEDGDSLLQWILERENE